MTEDFVRTPAIQALLDGVADRPRPERDLRRTSARLRAEIARPGGPGRLALPVAPDQSDAPAPSRLIALQLADAAESRELVDQAKGMLMHALGCSAEEALQRMRQISQTSNLKVTEVAARVIESRGEAALG